MLFRNSTFGGMRATGEDAGELFGDEKVVVRDVTGLLHEPGADAERGEGGVAAGP